MGKYDALGTFLRRWAVRNDGHEVELTFAQIEGLIGAPLPKAAAHMAWWCDQSGVQSRAWHEAGFKARLIESEEFVKFRRNGARSRGGGLPLRCSTRS
jgi:hypothetical protein